jgi:hypothetical protein
MAAPRAGIGSADPREGAMRRSLTLAICTAAALAVATPAHAGHGGGSPHDFAAGGGTNGFFQLGLAARSAPDGSDPRGYVSARSRPNGGFPVPFRFGGEVTCLRVEGNRASIKYRFDHANNPALVGGGIQIFVEDNGEPRDGRTPDATAFRAPLTQPAFEASDPSRCEPPSAAVYTTGEDGNFVVHDAAP